MIVQGILHTEDEKKLAAHHEIGCSGWAPKINATCVPQWDPGWPVLLGVFQAQKGHKSLWTLQTVGYGSLG
jgi:hypothetical protein